MKVSFFLRLKFAWKAFCLSEYKHVFPYEYNCHLVKNAGVCDNNRRESRCTNPAVIALKNPAFEIQMREADWSYHVCKECAEKYIGSNDGEKFEQ